MKKVLEKLNGLRIRALTDPWILALLFMPFFKPVGLCWAFGTADMVFTWWKLAAAACVAVLFLSRPRVSAVTVLLGAYQVLLLVSTLVYGAGLTQWLYDAVSIAAFCLLMEMCVAADIKVLVKSLFWLLGALCLVNLGTVLLYPGGIIMAISEQPIEPSLMDTYFLGLDNTNALFILPMLGLAALYAGYKRWPLWAQLLLLALFSASICITWPATAVMGMAAFWAAFLLGRTRKGYLVGNVAVYYAVIAAMFLLLVVLRITEKFSFIIVDVLHKDVTLSHRTVVWANALARIGERPWLGYGKLLNESAMPLLGANHCHNVFLQAGFEAGIGGLAVCLATLGVLVRPLWRTRKSRSGYVLAAALFALLVDLMAETPVYPLAGMGILILCYHAPEVSAALEPAPETK